jgi:alkanesulfonate monooxygenase SsuD/methylene tetrahydromethanopterin reductase-like flavin-dependent oxidoreductase (luciferase family)
MPLGGEDLPGRSPQSLGSARAGALARETRRLRLGTSVVIAPFAHPLRIAEEWAMVDVFSGGRLDFGLGRGYQPREFAGLGVVDQARVLRSMRLFGEKVLPRLGGA